jgi:hypothetical protein
MAVRLGRNRASSKVDDNDEPGTGQDRITADFHTEESICQVHFLGIILVYSICSPRITFQSDLDWISSNYQPHDTSVLTAFQGRHDFTGQLQ